MRSIGAWKIKKLKAIVLDTFNKNQQSTASMIIDKIKAQIPNDWYETWECAWSEINRLIDDYIGNLIPDHRGADGQMIWKYKED